MLNATNTPRWRAWLLVVVACWAGVAPAFALTFTLGFSFRGPETRVWNFFPQSVETRQETEPQVADPHQGNEGHGYEIVSGVHVYLYANADPLGHLDPSGNFSLAELAISVAVIGTLDAIAQPAIRSTVGAAFAAAGFVPGAKVSISSLGIDSETPAILSDLGLSNNIFSDNLLVLASQRIATDAISGSFAGLGGKYLLGAFAEATAARTAVIDYTDQLNGGRKSLRGVIAVAEDEIGHHLIPWRLRTNAFVRKAAKGGFNINGAENSMALSDAFHNSSHPQYSVNVEQTLVTLNEAFPNATPAEAAAEIKALLGELRSEIVSLQLSGPTLP